MRRGVNDPALRQLLAGLTAVRGGDFSMRLPQVGDELMDEMAAVFNGMVDQLALFTSEVTRVAREVGTDGKLGGQAEVPGVSGTWKDLTDSVNAMAGNLTGQVRDIAEVATAVAKGDLSQKITVPAQGEILELKSTINTMVDQLSAFADEVTRVAREVGTEGRLGGQARVPGVGGTWRDLTDSVNFMAGNLTGQVRSIAHVATAVARGDLSQKITVDARGEILELKNTINTMVDQLSAFADEVTRVAREVGTQGNLGGQASVRGVSGTWKDLTDNVNVMASNLTSQVRNIAQVTTAVAQGDLSKKIDVDARGEILELKTTINTMVDQLSSFAAEVTRVAREVGTEGILGGQAEVEGVSGTWKRLTENVNELAGNLTRQVRAIAKVTSAVATGDLTRSITMEARGEVAELKDNINAMVQSLRETTRANQEQDWLKTNLARVSGMLQGQRDLTTVAELIMDELTPLVGAQHGTFFLAGSGGDDVALRLIAGYGCQADAAVPREFQLGQSLVGQAARTKKPIVVEQTPPGYLKISSSLGESAPVNLIVLPILFEGQILGVIELASFTQFTQVHQDFLNQLSETIGVNVNSIIASSRTDALLEESQRLATELQARSEELQARQEELQSSNAELEDKAALLARQNRDIEVKNLEIEQAGIQIEERARQLALASKYKSEFLANMSHELRTPLNSLLVLARLLAQNPDGNLTPKQVEYAGVIHSAGSDLLQLINDILDLSKVEAGRMDMHFERFPLRTLLADVKATFRPLTAEKGLRFAVDVGPDVPEFLTTDQQRLQQILNNLLSNAVKFTEAGRVELRVTTPPGAPTGDGPGGATAIAFTVADTGIGIAEENLDRIFGAFQQGDGTTSRRYGGTGLGLSISREVAALLGGAIVVRSELGVGSTFTLHLPLFSEAADDAAHVRLPVGGSIGRSGPVDPPSAAGLDASHVLVVESDSDGLLRLLVNNAAAQLANTGRAARISAAATPAQALASLAQRRHACVVLDLSLPDGSAFTFLEKLQERPDLRGIPVLAHATYRLDAAREQLAALNSRTRRVEILPSLDKLSEQITLHLRAGVGQARGGSPKHASVDHGSGRTADETLPVILSGAPVNEPLGLPETEAYSGLYGRRILVIDDDVRNVFAITSILDLYGLTVVQAPNGRRGIEILLANSDIDLILMDVMMPEMDGYATMTAIRKIPEFRALPIIAVTAKAMQGDREKCLAAGATDYVTKPVDAEDLLARMARQFHIEVDAGA